MRSLIRTADTEQDALEALHADGCTDGLPVVIPTPERVERMLAAAVLDPDVILGTVGPQHGEATVEKVAVNAVMAGCLPPHLPVVIAAVRAVCDERWDLTEVQSTTHNLGPCIVVNGPVCLTAGVASGCGALGPGHRANASIGRALRLVLINVGGGHPGVSDMALLGQPAKFTCCFAEREEDSPFEPLHVSRGLRPEQSAVTVIGAEAPHSVLCPPTDDEDDPSKLIRVLAASLSGLGTNNTYTGRGDVLVILNPGHAAFLHAFSYDRTRLQRELHAASGQPRGVLRELVGPLIPPGDDDARFPVVASPDDILVAVAGDAGLYSAVLPSWGAARHGNRAVTVEVLTDDACEI